MAKNNLKNTFFIYIDENLGLGLDISEPEWAIFDSNGNMAESGVGQPPVAAFEQAKRLIAIAPAGAVLLTSLEAPARNFATFLQALPNIVEGITGREAGKIHAVPGPRVKNGPLPVAVTDLQWIENTIKNIDAMGIGLTSMIPETLLTPLNNNSWSVVLGERTHFVRTGLFSGMPLDISAEDRPPEALFMLLEQARQEDRAPNFIQVFTQDGQTTFLHDRWEEELGVRVDNGGHWDWRTFAGEALENRMELLQGKYTPSRGHLWDLLGYTSALFFFLAALVLLSAPAMDVRKKRSEENVLISKIEQSFRRVFDDQVMADPEWQVSAVLEKSRWRAGVSGMTGFYKLMAALTNPVGAYSRVKAISYAQSSITLTVVMNPKQSPEQLASALIKAGLRCEISAVKEHDYGPEVTFIITDEP
ncbi:MAG: type II secretion system protein GspL [Nitrospinota bacterium]|nr:type II secretion system protein GspL [Nitrospinota bacterium]